MKGEILSIETAEKIAALEKENNELKNNKEKIKEWLKNHTVIVYTKKAPTELVGTSELVHLLYDDLKGDENE